jgi:hypothetical protein
MCEPSSINPSFFSAYRRGRRAYEFCGDAAVCPYKDKRTGQHGHITTFSRAYRRYWSEGLEDERNGSPDRYRRKSPRLVDCP